MVELIVKINNVWKNINLDQNVSFPIEFTLADVRDISKRNLSFTKTIELPIDKNNNEVFDMLFDVSASSFIDVRKNIPAKVLKNGVEIFNGNIIINAVISPDNKKYRYTCQLTNSLFNIISKLEKTNINKIGLERLDHEVNFTNIFDSWENKLPYFYPLIDYNNNWKAGALKEGIRSVDMKPAIRLDWLWNQLFTFTNTSYNSESINTDKIFERVILPTTSKEVKVSQDFIQRNTFRASLSSTWIPNPSEVNIYRISSNNQVGFRFSELIGKEVDGVFNPIYVPFDNIENTLGNFDFSNLFDPNNRSFVNRNAKLNQRFCVKLDLKVLNKFQDAAKGGDIYIRFWRQFNPITGIAEKYPIEIADFKNNAIDYPYKQSLSNGPIVSKNSVFITKPSGSYNNDRFSGYLVANPFNRPGFSSTGIVGAQNIIEENNNDYNGFKRYNFYVNTVFLDGSTPERKPLLLGERVWVEINTGFSSIWYEEFVKPQWNDSRLAPFELLPESYFFNELSDRNLDGSYTIDMNSIFPQNIKSLDIFNNIIKMYNLYVDVDKRDENILTIETRDKFYTGEYVDWSSKLDISEPITQELLVQKYKNIILTHKEDTDVYNTDYTNNFNKIYGEYNYDTGNEWAKDELKIETTFSPTPVTSPDSLRSVVFPVIISDSTSGNKNEYVGRNMRILQHSPLVLEPTLGNDYIKLDGVTFSFYPYAGHFSRPTEGESDINFGMPDKIYFDLNKINNNNLFELYWRKNIEELCDKDSRLIKAKFYLNEDDIYKFSFRKLVKVDGLSSDTINYFRVNKISYDATKDGSYEVELIKVRDFNRVDDCFCYEVNDIPYGGGSFSLFINNEWIDKTNELIPLPDNKWKWLGKSCDEITKWRTEGDFEFFVSGSASYTFLGTTTLPVANIFPSLMQPGIDSKLNWKFSSDNDVITSFGSGDKRKSSSVFVPSFPGTYTFRYFIDYSVDANWPYPITDTPNPIFNQLAFAITENKDSTGLFGTISYKDIVLQQGPYLVENELNTGTFSFTFSFSVTNEDIKENYCIWTRNIIRTRSSSTLYAPKYDIVNNELELIDFEGDVVNNDGAVEKLKCKPILNIPRVVNVTGYGIGNVNGGNYNQSNSNDTIISGDYNYIGDSSEGSIIVSSNNSTIINSVSSIVSSNTTSIFSSESSSIISSLNTEINESNGVSIVGSNNTLITGSTNSVVIGSNYTNLINSQNITIIGGSDTTIENQSDVIILAESVVQKVDLLTACVDEVLNAFPNSVPYNMVSGSVDEVRNLGSHTIVNLISAIR